MRNAEYALGISLEKYEIKKIDFEHAEILAPSYSVPFNIYISFEADKSVAMQIFNTLNLVKYDKNNPRSNDSILCIYADFQTNMWNIKNNSHVEASEKYEKDLHWWKPEIVNKNNLFAAHILYVDSCGGKVVPCNTKYNGRIVGQYVENQQKIYFLIEI